jgi:hypothetical protein
MTTDYIVNRSPDKYGGQQEDYKNRTKQLIAYCGKEFKAAKEKGKDLVQLFHKILEFLAKQRQQIAKDHKTINADFFGVRRDLDFKGITSSTCLVGCYKEYGDLILKSKLQPKLDEMKEGNKIFINTYKSFKNKKFAEKSSEINFEILDAKFSKRWKLSASEELYKRLCNICEITPKEPPYEPSHFINDLWINKEAMFQLKQNSPHDYEKLKNCAYTNRANETIAKDKQKTDWILATVSCEIKGKMLPLTQYLTWANLTDTENPIDQILKQSEVMILHQDPFLIKDMLDDCAEIFQRALQSDSKEEKALKNRVALLNYLLSYAMPFYRGSSAISEWIEQAIYLSHGYELSYDQKKMVNLEALSHPLNEFIEGYGEMITLTQVKSND